MTHVQQRARCDVAIWALSDWLLDVQGQALIFNAAAEIGAGILLLLGLLTPQRSIMLAFVYWRALPAHAL